MITLAVVLHREDSAAIYVSLEGDVGASVVLPLSQIKVEAGVGRQLRVTMPTWLARDRHLITRADDRQGRLV